MYVEEQLLGPNMRSRDSAVSTHMRFENRTGEYVRIFWWNYEGQKVAYRTLPPNTAYRQQSFVSHPWTYKCIPFAPSGRPRRFSEADELVVVDDQLVMVDDAVAERDVSGERRKGRQRRSASVPSKGSKVDERRRATWLG